MTLALARKYRPRSFATVAVQSHVANTLKGAIARDRVAHGYLFCGPRGTGKTTLARVLAMALNCERRGDPALQGEPCGRCPSCERIWSGSASLDVVEIDAASNRGVEDAKDLRERAMYAPSGDDRYKVYIVDEAHMLTREAWNALLKVLEEPPPRVVFAFATTEPQKIAQAAAPVLSRLQRFDLRRIGPGEIRDRLALVLGEEGVPFAPDALALIARAADGGLRDALSLTDQVLSLGEVAEVTVERVQEALGLVPDDELLALLDLAAARDGGALFPAIQRLADGGVDFALMLAGLGRLLRAQLALEMGGPLADIPDALQRALEARRGRMPAGDLLRMLHALVETEPLFRRSGQPQLLFELLLVRWAYLDRTIELEEVLKGFGGGNGDDPPPRRVAREPRVASAHALPPTPPPIVAPAPPPAAPASAAVVAAAMAARANAPTPRSLPPLTLERVQARWPEVADALRRAGRKLLAEAVQRLEPVAVTPEGAVRLGYAPAHDTFAAAVEGGRVEVLAAVREALPGATALSVERLPNAPQAGEAPSAAPRRLTAQDVQQQRRDQLARTDPLLEAAIRALDLELLS
jgi:DNA polymerase-3 subunit gamma/tau